MKNIEYEFLLEIIGEMRKDKEHILKQIKQLEEIIMATRTDLNNAIAAVPAAVVAALPPSVTPPAEDFTPEITALGQIPAQVAALLTPTPPAS